jgi:hypothetical protein
MRVATLAGVVLLTGLMMVACGKKTAPIPPEDVPPGKQERSNSSSNRYAVHSFQIDEVTLCSS